ncbi:MAG: sensor histidine kinase, partial [Gemmataceae bacterium]
GTIRAVWLKDRAGLETLLLIRPARLESKLTYQGVLLDWPKLRDSLLSDIQQQFPGATLTPRSENLALSERSMTTLPVEFATGPVPELSPAGWTPLRIGLASAWLAGLVALFTVWLGARSLLDLSDRRIRFVSSVTHELRTPLTSLRLYLDLLTSGLITDEAKQREYLMTLHGESERLNQLIENVLDFARLERRSIQANIRPMLISDVLKELDSTWQERLKADDRSLTVVSTLPAGALAPMDPVIVQQILNNLLDNARKYSAYAEDRRLWLWAKPGDRQTVFFEIEDRGPGVPAEERSALFQPFQRGERVDARVGGAGLGLALAKQWAQLLGGSLNYRPADGGVGACFRLELPLLPSQAPTEASRQ